VNYITTVFLTVQRITFSLKVKFLRINSEGVIVLRRKRRRKWRKRRKLGAT